MIHSECQDCENKGCDCTWGVVHVAGRDGEYVNLTVDDGDVAVARLTAQEARAVAHRLFQAADLADPTRPEYRPNYY